MVTVPTAGAVRESTTPVLDAARVRLDRRGARCVDGEAGRPIAHREDLQADVEKRVPVGGTGDGRLAGDRSGEQQGTQKETVDGHADGQTEDEGGSRDPPVGAREVTG